VINLDLTEEQQAVRELAQRLGTDVLAPAARAAEQDRSVAGDVRQKVLDSGLIRVAPESCGGGGVFDAVTQCVVAEALSSGDPGIALALLWDGSASVILSMAAGTDEQRSLLARLYDGAPALTSVALYEGFGRSPGEYRTTIARERSRWQVGGRKVAVSRGAEADSFLVIGIDPNSNALAAAVVEASAPGVSIEDDGPHLALDAAATATVAFDTTVERPMVLSGEGNPAVLSAAVNRVRLLLAAANVGCAQRALDYAAKYALDRVAFGRPIAAFQGVSFLLAEASMRIQSARFETFDAATVVDDLGPGAEQAVGKAVSYSSATATQTTRDALQVLGGHGFITDHPVELWYRSAATISAIDFDPLLSAFAPAL
jgi:alkylation response protein AidB-like acyl-CoA dehydrogenase